MHSSLPHKLTVAAAGLVVSATLIGAHAQNSIPPEQTSPAADSTVLEVSRAVYPTFPPEMRHDGIQGQFGLQLHITETGVVDNAQIVSGDAVPGNIVLDAVKTWKFKPFIKHGVPVDLTLTLPFDLDLQPGRADDGVAPEGASSSGATADPSQSQAKPTRVRVSQGVLQGALLHQVQPKYPSAARSDRRQGSVVMRAVIGKNGHLKELTAMSGPVDFVPAAMNAVVQWRYRPWLLQGEPVEVETIITVNFRLSE